MKPQHQVTIRKCLSEIRQIARELPPGKANKISNRCDKISIIVKKTNKPNYNTENHTDMKKFNSKAAILSALLEGRKLSQLDCKEFQVEDMRTPISHLRDRYKNTHDLQTRWIVTPVLGRRIKEYSLVKKEA